MTGISYVNETVNCVTGCTKVSEGCDNCYALAMSYRLWKMVDPKYNGVSYCGFSGEGVNWTGRINFYIEPLRRVLKWRKPKRIFLNSMSDTFHPSVTDEQIKAMLDVIRQTPIHIYLLLTKRPERLKDFTFPDNVWLGVTVENQAMADERIPLLLQTPAKVKWISVEPMLGEITARWAKWVDYKATIKAQGRIFHLEGLKRLDWVVIGCESGVNRRECKLEWVRSLVAQCTEAQVPVWVKQLEINGKVVQDVSKFPADLQIREVPNG